MTSKYLATVLAVMCYACAARAQVVYPGGGVSSMSDVPGLTNALGETVTNVVKGADTGGPTGNVAKVGRQAVVMFPTIPSMLYISTNSIHGTVYIDPSGTNTIDYLHTFSNIPFITLTPVGTNINQVLTPVLLTVSETNATFAVMSSGSIVTNPYRVDWQANDGAGLSWSGTSLAALGGATNIYRNDGANGMNVFYLPVAPAAGTWLAGNSLGYGTWQQRTIANLVDGANVLKADGTVKPTADIDFDGNAAINMDKVQVTTGAGAGKVLTSDANGLGTWQTPSVAGWSTYAASSALNMNNYGISAVGPLVVNGAARFNGAANHYSAANFYGLGTFWANVEIKSGQRLDAAGPVALSKSGGSYGAPDLHVVGYGRYDGTADFRKTGGSYASPDMTIYGKTRMYDTLYNDSGILITAQSAGALVLRCLYGSAQIDSDLGVGGNFLAVGSKTFRIPHPLDANKYLFHSTVESPRNDLLYRGKVKLVNGTATVSIDAASRMTDGTFAALTKNADAQTWNNASFVRVKAGPVSNGKFTITSETPCNDEVSWVVYAERNDPASKNAPFIDGNGDYQPEVMK